ncbi:protein kinase PINOID-like [Silene latifolia]|uniref:protein kinase PINOID-like n=1 Tax=Silene latifolia TaxID=37657 RepID=UPI003D7776A5
MRYQNTTISSHLSFDLALAKSNSENLSLLKPHRSSESAFEAIVSSTAACNRPLSFRDFNLVRKVGSGDISTVYLCRLRSDDKCEYAMKVVDKEALAAKNKTQRAEMEKKILKMLDHPFLPTLYAQFDASHFSCIVMEYCSGGDLYSLRSKLPNKRFPLHSARFYAAEVLVALEYLHMLGIIYRDLKPENVLVRSDGHIMLSDFDLSLCSDSIPAVQWPDDPTSLTPFPPSSPSPAHTKSPPFFACLPYTRLFRSKKIQTLTNNKLFVAEPIAARSSSFVGTHEYITPEVAAGNSHGNAVDWWALGIFIYEMIYGRTPFKGSSNVATLRNILMKPLAFPTSVPSSSLEGHARDLIKGLLRKDPVARVGFTRGAADIKTHPFFKGLNFALIRSVAPPLVPGAKRPGPHKHLFDTMSFKDVTVTKKKESSPYDFF